MELDPDIFTWSSISYIMFLQLSCKIFFNTIQTTWCLVQLVLVAACLPGTQTRLEELMLHVLQVSQASSQAREVWLARLMYICLTALCARNAHITLMTSPQALGELSEPCLSNASVHSLWWPASCRSFTPVLARDVIMQVASAIGKSVHNEIQSPA